MVFRFFFSHYTFQAFALIFILLCNIRLSAQFENINVSNNSADQSETHICVSPLNSNFLLATYHDDRNNINNYPQAGYSFSTDGGLTWPLQYQGVIVGNGYPNAVDPSGGFDRYGNAFYCYMTRSTCPQYASGHGPIFVSKTTNFGSNWSHTQVTSICSDKPLMAVDNTGGNFDGRIYVTYTRFYDYEATRIKFSYSTNNGVSFSSEVTLGAEFGTNRYSMPAVGPNGEVYVCWRNNNGGVNACSLFVCKSTDGGQSFSSPIVAAMFTLRAINPNGCKATPEPNLANIAVDPLNSNVYIVYTAAEYESNSDLRVWWIRSTNGGSTFSTPQIISLPAGGVHQFFGTMTVNGNHRISVFFETISSAIKRNYFVTESFDDGQNFRPPIKINEVESSCEGRGHHYQWIASISDCTYPCWTASVGAGEVYTGKGVTISLSNSADATASGSVRKSVYKSSNSSWNNVFISDNSLFYHYSKKDGKAWTCREKISGSIGLNSSSNPSLSLYNNEFHTTYKNIASRIYYNRTVSGTWSQPYQLANVESNVTGIASIVDGSGTGHVIYSYYDGLSAYIIKHGTFSTFDPIPTITNFAEVTSSLSIINSPTIHYDNSNNPHIAWYQGGDIYYSFKQLSMWSSPFNVSSSLLSSEAPCINLGSDNKVHISWQEDVSGTFDIYYRNKTSGGVWGSIGNISSNSANSIQPYMEISLADQPIFVWAEGGMNSPYDIKYSYPNYYQSGTVKVTSLDSRNPTFTQKNGVDIRVYVLWTDGPINRYLIENNYIDLIPQNLPEPVTSNDSGWYPLNSGAFEHLWSVFFVNNSTGFATGEDVVLKTTNSGINWNIYTDSVLIYNCSSIFFPNLTTGYLATADKVMKTTNQGQNWVFNAYLNFAGVGYLFFINADTGFATHMNGQFAVVSRTTNGGANWFISGGGDFSPREIFFPSISTGYVAFRYAMLKTTDIGNSWYTLSGPTQNNKALYFTNNNTGYLTSRTPSSPNPNIRKTTDGGYSWQVLQPGTNERLNDVFFVNNDTGYCAGDTGVIIRTTNAGDTWQRQFSGTMRSLRQIFFTSANTGYIVGDSGLILKTTTGGSPIGIEPISNSVPNDYQLYQNYPNPFNPATTIKFDIPHALYVKLTVYDALGRIADVLLNSRLSAGSYEIPWNASMFASGIYYLRLEAGNFSSAKKMVLLK